MRNGKLGRSAGRKACGKTAERAAAVAGFRAEVAQRWDLARLHEDMLASQRRRRFVAGALRQGMPTRQHERQRFHGLLPVALVQDERQRQGRERRDLPGAARKQGRPPAGSATDSAARPGPWSSPSMTKRTSSDAIQAPTGSLLSLIQASPTRNLHRSFNFVGISPDRRPWERPHAHRRATRPQAGACWSNAFNLTPTELPFGGMMRSGLGCEDGRAANERRTQPKAACVTLGGVEPY